MLSPRRWKGWISDVSRFEKSRRNKRAAHYERSLPSGRQNPISGPFVVLTHHNRCAASGQGQMSGILRPIAESAARISNSQPSRPQAGRLPRRAAAYGNQRLALGPGVPKTANLPRHGNIGEGQQRTVRAGFRRDASCDAETTMPRLPRRFAGRSLLVTGLGFQAANTSGLKRATDELCT